MEVLEVLDVEIFSIIFYIQPLKLPNENDLVHGLLMFFIAFLDNESI